VFGLVSRQISTRSPPLPRRGYQTGTTQRGALHSNARPRHRDRHRKDPSTHRGSWRLRRGRACAAQPSHWRLPRQPCVGVCPWTGRADMPAGPGEDFDLVGMLRVPVGTTWGRSRPLPVNSGQQVNRLANPRFQRISTSLNKLEIVLVMRRSGVRFPKAAPRVIPSQLGLSAMAAPGDPLATTLGRASGNIHTSSLLRSPSAFTTQEVLDGSSR
jgi:hypothetical protein